MVARALLWLVCACAADARASYGLREREPLNCGFGHYGSRAGAAQRLVVTHLSPGVADWNVAVPMPPVCKDAEVTGVETAVCDADAPPDVTMSGLLKARVHRRGQLKGFAAVNVTVHCILRTDPPDTLSLHHADTRSTYEVLSNELNSNEQMSNEVMSHEFVSNGLTSIELFPNTVKLTLPTTTTSPLTTMLPPQEVPPRHVELVTPPQQMTLAPPPTQSPQLKEISSPGMQLNIKIVQPAHETTSEQNQVSYEVSMPLPYKERPQKAASSWESEPSTPPRLSVKVRRPPSQRPCCQARPPSQLPCCPERPPNQLPCCLGSPPGQHPCCPRSPPGQRSCCPGSPSGQRPCCPGRPPPRHRVPPASPLPPELPAVPALLEPQLLLTPLLKPMRLFSPRINFLQRPAPLFIFRHF